LSFRVHRSSSRHSSSILQPSSLPRAVLSGAVRALGKSLCSFIIVSTRPGLPVSGTHRSALIAHHSPRELDHPVMPRPDAVIK
jgi:hypothetical protein